MGLFPPKIAGVSSNCFVRFSIPLYFLSIALIPSIITYIVEFTQKNDFDFLMLLASVSREILGLLREVTFVGFMM